MTNRVTIVFDFDITAYEGNPFKAETPFGRPISIVDGDVQESAAITKDLRDSFEELIRVIKHESYKGTLRLTLAAEDALDKTEKALEDFSGSVKS